MDLKELRRKLKWLDPFTYVDRFIMPKVNPEDNDTISWVVYLVSAFVFAWLIYAGLGFILATESPIMIVLSASMQPLFYRGDVIFLHGTGASGLEGIDVQLQGFSLSENDLDSFAEPIYEEGSNDEVIESIRFDSGQEIPITKDGSIVVYWSSFRQRSIIHRVVAKLHADDGVFLLTKGDSVTNHTIDQDCGEVENGQPEKDCIELYPVPIERLQGKAFFWVPAVGCVKLWLLDDLGSLITGGKLPVDFLPGNIC